MVFIITFICYNFLDIPIIKAIFYAVIIETILVIVFYLMHKFLIKRKIMKKTKHLKSKRIFFNRYVKGEITEKE